MNIADSCSVPAPLMNYHMAERLWDMVLEKAWKHTLGRPFRVLGKHCHGCNQCPLWENLEEETLWEHPYRHTYQSLHISMEEKEQNV